jgi:hypothetical protein
MGATIRFSCASVETPQPDLPREKVAKVPPAVDISGTAFLLRVDYYWDTAQAKYIAAVFHEYLNDSG